MIISFSRFGFNPHRFDIVEHGVELEWSILTEHGTKINISVDDQTKPFLERKPTTRKNIKITFVMFSKDILIYVKSILGCRHLDDVHGKVLNN